MIDYQRHTMTLLFDVPAALAADPERMADLLNLIATRITDLIDSDPALQHTMRSSGIDAGWEPGSWE
ncbi:MAG TPA: hypothetical protein PKA05_12885 [Roseiflexaceae bacterium]|nr:hypothetical protein [Roseiflexaceae bacterium]HMP41273.1 hypothetical protein [Roseiflexaceae bacterium]